MFHLLKIAVPAILTLANHWGSKFKVTPDQLDPWEAARRKTVEKDAAAKRVQSFAEICFGFPSVK